MFVSRMVFLLFNTVSRFVRAFLPTSKCLQFVAAVMGTVLLEPKKIRSATVSSFSPSICYKVMGLDSMILVF